MLGIPLSGDFLSIYGCQLEGSVIKLAENRVRSFPLRSHMSWGRKDTFQNQVSGFPGSGSDLFVVISGDLLFASQGTQVCFIPLFFDHIQGLKEQFIIGHWVIISHSVRRYLYLNRDDRFRSKSKGEGGMSYCRLIRCPVGP